MLVAGLALTGVAALIHVYIFLLESVWWRSRARQVFGTTPEQAEQTAEMAFNQGFYNLFLAVGIGVGTVLVALDERTVGLTLVLFGAASMVAAGLVLVLSSPAKARAALVQLTPPLIGGALLVVDLL
ncbi:putative membrane protein [Nocardioides zeae]|uniref:Membrane protein n=2 Tax=Nocardioides zeae TaxID=1457234 RepID=A0AAJ1X0U2_9ACTN|nr:DUF1304 domain-containing protein [Nocardioides zeae]MDQ1104211.1 putative membrane protein [Nocardioides zeae]MDR6176100.1 putative membrane protein [Nocardioides zeae]MDR6210246.1 putative membrane protein [Nocardioides zeae]